MDRLSSLFAKLLTYVVPTAVAFWLTSTYIFGEVPGTSWSPYQYATSALALLAIGWAAKECIDIVSSGAFALAGLFAKAFETVVSAMADSAKAVAAKTAKTISENTHSK